MQTAPLFTSILKTNPTIYCAVNNISKSEASKLLLLNVRQKKFVVCQGGGDAGKTVTILQILALACKVTANTKCLVAADTMPNLKDGAISAFEKYVKPFFQHDIKFYNQTDKVLIFYNGSKIKFKSFEKEERARGAEWDYAFLNESNLFSYDLFWQIQRKVRQQVFIDYNPTSKFWCHDKLIEGKENQFTGKVVYFQTDHRHNPFISEEDHLAYENISDPELFKVYSRGETGIIKGLIFSGTEINEMPKDIERFIWGIDYGYTNDPTAIVKIGIRGKDRFIKECFYEPCDDAERIKIVLIENGWDASHHVYSEHDKRIIAELINIGVPIYLANKKNKISNISKCKTFRLYYTKESVNYKKEIESYKWATATNLTTGETITTNAPIDGNDHLCDAKVYAVVTDAIMYGL